MWEAAFLGWTWEASEKEDDEGLYYGRVSSPLTYDTWEYGYFTEEQLRNTAFSEPSNAVRASLSPRFLTGTG